MIYGDIKIKLGLVAGKVYQKNSLEIRSHLEAKGWFFWAPEDVKDRVAALAAKDYENEPAIITAKVLMRQ